MRGRKPKQESRSAELRQKLIEWKQTPESSRPSLRALARELGTSHQLLTVSIATSLTSQGYLTMFGTTLSATSVDMQSGTLVGGGTIEGSLTNNGYLLPTNGETLAVTGDYTQTAGGELSVNFAT